MSVFICYAALEFPNDLHPYRFKPFDIANQQLAAVDGADDDGRPTIAGGGMMKDMVDFRREWGMKVLSVFEKRFAQDAHRLLHRTV
jgi:hypothetical protein